MNQNSKPIEIKSFPGEAVDRHLKKYGHLPITELCDEKGSCMNQTKEGWRGDIPCKDCGTKDNIVWFTDSIIWNEVMKKEGGRILCPVCFVIRAEKIIKTTGWKIIPEEKAKEAEQRVARKCIEKLESNGFVVGVREGDAFKASSPKEIELFFIKNQ